MFYLSVMARCSIGKSSRLTSVGQRLEESSSVLLSIIGSQVVSGVSTCNHLCFHLIDSVFSGVNAEFSIEVIKMALNEIFVVLSHWGWVVASGNSTSDVHWSYFIKYDSSLKYFTFIYREIRQIYPSGFY